MKATVLTSFRAVRKGEVHPVEIKVGEKLDGELAEIAVKAGWAKSAERKARRHKAAEQ